MIIPRMNAAPGGGRREAATNGVAGDHSSSPLESSIALQLTDIAHRFGARWVLRGCSLAVARGEAVALVGRNGAGKTTLLRIMASLLRPTRGEGRVFGCDLRRDGGAIRERVGMLGSTPALYEDLTAAEHLRFACRMRGLRPEPHEISYVLETVGLGPHRDARIRGFSSGMRRRVDLARVLMRPPRLLLMDEPYASFDADGIELINALVRQTRASGGTAVVATHDVVRVRAVADRAVRIDAGLLHAAMLDADPAGEPAGGLSTHRRATGSGSQERAS